MLPKTGNNVEATFDFVERIVRLVAFHNVACVDEALFMFRFHISQAARTAAYLRIFTFTVA